MSGHQQLTDRVTTQIECWAKRHGITLTHEAKRQLVSYVGDIAIDRGTVEQAKALSLAQETVYGLSGLARKEPNDNAT